jgi:hypothetical protein
VVALTWWEAIPFEIKFYRLGYWLDSKGRGVTSIHPDDVTNTQITEIYKFHTQKHENRN